VKDVDFQEGYRLGKRTAQFVYKIAARRTIALIASLRTAGRFEKIIEDVTNMFNCQRGHALALSYYS
jgi:hypothetical protein